MWKLCTQWGPLDTLCDRWVRLPGPVRRVVTLAGLGALIAVVIAVFGNGEPASYRWTWHIPG